MNLSPKTTCPEPTFLWSEVSPARQALLYTIIHCKFWIRFSGYHGVMKIFWYPSAGNEWLEKSLYSLCVPKQLSL